MGKTNRLKMMRVLVTGSRGYLGAALLPALQNAGHEVTGLDTGFYEGCDFLDVPPSVPTIWKDVRDIEKADVADQDVVIHLAALSNDPLGELSPQLTFEINHAATLRLAEVARAVGVKRFIFLSSCSNYGVATDSLVDETTPLKPLTPYGESKAMAESDLGVLADARFSVVFLRCATVYGVSPRTRLDVVVNNLSALAHTTGRIVLQSDGTAWRPLVHIGDAVKAISACMLARAEDINGEAFNVGRTDQNFRVSQVASIIQDTFPGTSVVMSPSASRDARSYRIDCEKASSRLSAFSPTCTLSTGVQWVRNCLSRVDPGELDMERYTRLSVLRRRLEQDELDSSLRWRSNAIASSRLD